MLGSAHDGEALNAARAADRLLRECGVTWLDALVAGVPAASIEPPMPRRRKPVQPMDWADMAREVLQSDAASAWARGFARSLLDRWQGRPLTRRQAAALTEIWNACRAADAPAAAAA